VSHALASGAQRARRRAERLQLAAHAHDGIEQRLAELRPADAAYFAQRLNDFKVRINDANKRWMAEFAPYRGSKIITYHNSWPNFAKHFGLNVVGYVEPKPARAD